MSRSALVDTAAQRVVNVVEVGTASQYQAPSGHRLIPSDTANIGDTVVSLSGGRHRFDPPIPGVRLPEPPSPVEVLQVQTQMLFDQVADLTVRVDTIEAGAPVPAPAPAP